MSDLTPVQQYYKGKTIFVTGATGFMGKVLLEKLLYSCHELKEIIIICRTKRDKPPKSRLIDMWKLPIFQRIKDERPDVMKKVTVFQGDVTNELLGLSKDDLNYVTDNTNIVFHIAALLKMEGSLSESIDMNVCGTRRTLDVAHKMKNLEAFVHVSTTFCNCEKDITHEKVYDFHHKPEDLMRMIEWMDPKTVDSIKHNLLESHPNIYTYTKRLAELYVRDQYETLPVIIARPSIVVPALKEPLPGWVEGFNGLTGILVGVAKGVIRSLMVVPDAKLETIPVDLAIAGLILIPHHINQSKPRPAEIPVFNVTLSEHVKKNAGWIMEKGSKYSNEYPLSYPLWYPNVTITLNKYYHWFNVIFFMWLPSLFVDLLLMILGQKRFMMTIHKRIMAGLTVLQFFQIRAWNFKSDNFMKINNYLTERDLEIFFVPATIHPDIEDEYFLNCCLGGRIYLMKEPISNIPKAKLILKCMYVLDCACKLLISSWLCYWLVTKIENFNKTLA